jgi:hypothetical protein
MLPRAVSALAPSNAIQLGYSTITYTHTISTALYLPPLITYVANMTRSPKSNKRTSRWGKPAAMRDK